MDSEKKNKKKQIAILGSTGSIGTQALQVIEEHPDLYEAYALTANNRVELLIAQARKFQPEVVVIANEEKYAQLKEALSDLPIKVYAGCLLYTSSTNTWLIGVALSALSFFSIQRLKSTFPRSSTLEISLRISISFSR